MLKNVASQKWIVFAFDETDNTPKTGDAAQITAEISKDGAAGGGNITDTHPTELEDGYYVFDLEQGETNADLLLILPESSTGNIQVIGVPGAVWTTSLTHTKAGYLDAAISGRSSHDAAGVKTAIEANGSKIDHLWEMTEDDSGTRRLTTNSLEQSPSGGDATEANQTTIINALLGPGDYTVTLTIRTVGGTPVSGITVWLNTSNERSTSVAGNRVTDINGEVEFELDYTTYYIFCNLSGYIFASASFTASAGNVSFTKDIASATSSGSSAFYSDSFLSRAIVDVRESTDEPTQAAKYTDARIIDHLEKAYILVLSEINRNSRTPAVAKITKTIASGTTAYVLPHTVGSVHGIYKTDDEGGKVFYDSRSKYNTFGRGMWLENQTLHIQTTGMYGLGTELTIEYIPSGIARLHNGVCTLNAAGTIATLGATPNAGTLDTHHEAYAGSVFRCLGVDGTTIVGNYLQERVIIAYDETTREATLDAPLSPIPTTDDGNIYYEIAPSISKGMDTVVALYAAHKLVTNEGNSKRAGGILKSYRNEIRNVRLTAYYSLMPTSVIDRSDSYNNRRYNQR